MDDDNLIPMIWYDVNKHHVKEDIASILNQNINLIGEPKLFVVVCDINCITELLIQVYSLPVLRHE